MPATNVKPFAYFLACLIMVFSANILSADERLSYAAPSVIPHTTPDMQRPGFWIAKHQSPDRIILSPTGIEKLNQNLIKQNLTKDILDFKADDLKEIDEQIQKSLFKFVHGEFYDDQGKQPAKRFYDTIQSNIAIPAKGDWQVRYAIVSSMTNQRLLPTDEILTSEPFDLEFDEVQNSSLDIGTPVVVLRESRDQKWFYVYTSASAGWVKKSDLAFCDLPQVKAFLRPEKFIVVTSAKADLYQNQAMTLLRAFVRMGAVFPVRKDGENALEILYPTRSLSGDLEVQSAFIKKGDVSDGFLPYTPRIIIEQAFKMLNAPYGWGGLNGEQDCSAFLREIFGAVGINLPRNSGEQGQAGALLKDFSNGVPGITVGQMKGHIILFLGMHAGRPYAIHEVFAYREPNGGQDRARVVNRVIVSDLNLGKGSKKGSLLERIIAIREMR